MKTAAQQGFWSLRPTLTARGLEFSCWLVAGLLAVALAMFPAPPAGPPAHTLRAIGITHAADLLLYRRHCIDRILANDLGDTEEYLVRQINQQCTTRRRTAARLAGPACGRPFTVRFTPIARRVTGCLAG